MHQEIIQKLSKNEMIEDIVIQDSYGCIDEMSAIQIWSNYIKEIIRIGNIYRGRVPTRSFKYEYRCDELRIEKFMDQMKHHFVSLKFDLNVEIDVETLMINKENYENKKYQYKNQDAQFQWFVQHYELSPLKKWIEIKDNECITKSKLLVQINFDFIEIKP